VFELFVNVFVLKIGKRLENETLKKREEKDILIDQHAPTFLFYLSFFSFFFFFFFFFHLIYGDQESLQFLMFYHVEFLNLN
jgi:hypothetical protein